MHTYIVYIDTQHTSIFCFQISGAEFVMRDADTGCVNVGADVLLLRLATPILVTLYMGMSLGIMASLTTDRLYEKIFII